MNPLNDFDARFGGVMDGPRGAAQTVRGTKHRGFGRKTVKKAKATVDEGDDVKDYDNEEDSGYEDEYDNEDYGSENGGFEDIEVDSFFYYSQQPD